MEYEYMDWVTLKKWGRIIGSLGFYKYFPLKFLVSSNFSVNAGYFNDVSVIVGWRVFFKTSPLYLLIRIFMPGVGLPSWHNCKESTYQCRSCKRHVFDLWVENIPWRRKWPPIPVFLPGKFPGRRNLACYSPWDCRESDLTEHTPDVFLLTEIFYTFHIIHHLLLFLFSH